MCASCIEEGWCALQVGNVTQEMCTTLFSQLSNGTLCVLPPPDTRGASITANGQQQLQGEGEGGAAPTDTG